jgi:hypothetical protein
MTHSLSRASSHRRSGGSSSRKDEQDGNMMKIELTGAICKQALTIFSKIFALKFFHRDLLDHVYS